MSLGGELPSDLCRSLRIRRLLAAVTVFHAMNDKEDLIGGDADTRKAWKEVEARVRDLRKNGEF